MLLLLVFWCILDRGVLSPELYTICISWGLAWCREKDAVLKIDVRGSWSAFQSITSCKISDSGLSLPDLSFPSLGCWKQFTLGLLSQLCSDGFTTENLRGRSWWKEVGLVKFGSMESGRDFSILDVFFKSKRSEMVFKEYAALSWV